MRILNVIGYVLWLGCLSFSQITDPDSAFLFMLSLMLRMPHFAKLSYCFLEKNLLDEVLIGLFKI
jgi:hypothetical protein